MLLYRRRDDTRHSGPLSVLFFSTFSAIVFCKGQSLLDLNTPVSGQGCPNKHSSIFTFLKLIYLIYRFFFLEVFVCFVLFTHLFFLQLNFQHVNPHEHWFLYSFTTGTIMIYWFFFTFNKMPALWCDRCPFGAFRVALKSTECLCFLLHWTAHVTVLFFPPLLLTEKNAPFVSLWTLTCHMSELMLRKRNLFAHIILYAASYCTQNRRVNQIFLSVPWEQGNSILN